MTSEALAGDLLRLRHDPPCPSTDDPGMAARVERARRLLQDVPTDLISTDGARELGIGCRELRVLGARGELTRLTHGWYALSAPATREELHALRAVAHLRRVREGSALSHQSAAIAHGLPVLDASLDRVWLAVPPPESRRVLKDVVHTDLRVESVRAVAPGTVSAVLAVPAAHAIVGTGLNGGARAFLAAGDAALRLGLVTRGSIEAAVGSARGLRGVGSVRAAVAHLDGRHESVGETLTRFALRLLGVAAEPQVMISGSDWSYRVDFVVDGDLVIEFDGAVKYDGAEGRDALVAEKVREDRIRSAGYRVLRVTWADVMDPRRLAGLVAAARDMG